MPFSEGAAHRGQSVRVSSLGHLPSQALPKSAMSRERNIGRARGEPFLYVALAGVIIHIHFTNPARELYVNKERRQTEISQENNEPNLPNANAAPPLTHVQLVALNRVSQANHNSSREN